METNATSAKPSTQEIVTQDVLYYASRSFNTLAVSRGFGGVSNPSQIWQEMTSDGQNAFAYYRELEEKDDDVSGPIEELKLSVLGRPRQVAPADDTSHAEEVAQFIRDVLDSIPNLHTALDAMLDAPGYGVSIAELIYEVSEGQVSVSAINDCPQELFTFGPIGYPQTGPMRFIKSGADLSGGELVDENKFLVWSYRPRSRNRRGRPLLRSVFWPSWFKRNAMRFWLRYAEKGPGTAAAKYPKSATPDEKQQALRVAEEVIEKVAIAVPEDTGLITELLTSARSQNPAVYEHLMDKMAMKITRRILGQTLTSFGSESGAGSRALGEVHKQTKHAREVELSVALQNVVNDQLVKRLVMWNFGPNAPVPKWTITTEDEEQLAARLQIDVRLQRMGAPITRSYVLNKYKLPEPTPKDKILTPLGGGESTSQATSDAQFMKRLRVNDVIIEALRNR